MASSKEATPAIPVQAVHAIWLLHCPCGCEWIGAVDPAAAFTPVICANCGKAAYIDESVLPLYVRGVVLDGPPAEPGKEDAGDASGMADDGPVSTESDRGIAGIAKGESSGEV